MEAAASLFGPEDASSDPFASLGGQEASVEVPQVDQNAPQTGHSTDVDPNGSTFFDQTGSQDSFYNSGNGGNTVQEPAYSYGATPVYPPQHDGMPVQQNYQPTAANGHGYQTETSNYSAPAQVTPTPSSYEPRQSPSNGYAPASNTTYQLATYGQQYTPTTSYNVDGMPNQSTGQSYQPTTYGSYAPNGGTNSQPGYGTPSYAPTYPVQQTPVAPPPASNFRVPPPTTTTVKAVARPKVANAYDPPIPAARPSRRQTPRVSSAPQPYGYNAYETQRTPSVGSSLSTPPPHMNGYHQPSLPPPPPKPPQPAYDQTHARSLPPPPPRAPSSAGQQASYGVYGGTLSTSPPEWNPASMGNGHSASYVAPSLNGAANGLMDTSAPSYPPEASEDFFDQVASEPQQHGAWETNHVQPDLAAKPHDVHNTRDSPPAHLTEPDWLSQQNAEAKPVEDDPPTSSHPSIPEEYPDPESADLESSSDASGIPSDQISSSTNETRATSPPGPPPARYSPVVQPSVYAPPRTSSPLAGPPISRTSMDSYAPPRAASPASSFRESQPPANPYAPPTQTQHPNGHRTSSPLATMRANTLGYPQEKPFTSPPPRTDRNRSMSGGSLLSISSLSAEDPYAPSRRIASSGALGQHRQASPVQHRGGTPDPPVAQELPLKHVFQSHYAPSPSLLGANDPLGRTTARVPVISFGFGGKMVTCFHGADSFSTGFDVALSSRNTTQIRLRSLKSLIPEAHQDHTSSFPGPLFGDPGSQTTSLVRTGPNTHTKNKKTQVVKYLTDRATELELGLRYLETDSLAYGRSNGKLILTKLLKVMVEHDGKLSGSPEIDMAVRTVLVPALEVTAEPSTFMTMTDTTSFGYPAVAGQGGSSGQELSTTVLKASHLEKIEEFLMRGERKKAYHYALDEKLWAHAMVIASSIDKDAWKEVVGEFLKGELGSKPAETSGNASQGRESLRVVYSLFSGQGPSAVQEFNPQNLLLRATAATQLQPPLASQITPKTPNFVAPVQPVPTIASLAKWPETVAMMLSSPLPAETSAALTALGDQLSAAQLHEASHVCYMLSPQTSPLGGLGQAAARLTLIGSKSPQAWSLFSKDPDPFVFSEVLEFALSFTPVAKGQEPFAGIAHLQAYRFIRATSLVDLGDIQQANRYCEAISASLSRVSPYTTTTLLEQLKELSDRIAGTTQVDKSFWSGGKISKPSLNNIGGWLEGRFTKLVTGDEEKTPEEDKKPEGREFSGPFSQYSTISSTTPSARSSPQPTHVNPHTLPPPARSGSAMASASPYAYQPIDRASSAMDHVRRKSTPQPPPRATPASSTATSFYNTPSFGSLQSQENLVTPRASNVGEDDPQDAGAWWNSTGYDEGPAGKTPTTATFMKVNHEVPANESTDGFISLMDNHPYSVGPSRPSSEASHRSPVSRPSFDEDEDDLGLSNSKPKPKKTDTSETLKPEAKVEETPQPAQPAESKPELQQNGSWFSRWWKKSDGPGPVKANLGEQSAFYYDKELKRWVNKNAPPEETKPAAPPPPPSRAQTASPGMTGHHPPPSPGGTPPPARAASAIDLSTSPPSRTVMRVRSNLVPPGAPESAPSTPTGSRLAPSGPPPGRPKSQASKRNVRNRYVDVFSQENGGNGAT